MQNIKKIIKVLCSGDGDDGDIFIISNKSLLLAIA